MALIAQHPAFAKKKSIRKVPVNDSSWLMHFQYDADTLQLTVVLKTGGEYTYNMVPAMVFDQFLQAPSKGKFYSQYIRGKYGSQRIVDKTVGPSLRRDNHGTERSAGSHQNARTNRHR